MVEVSKAILAESAMRLRRVPEVPAVVVRLKNTPELWKRRVQEFETVASRMGTMLQAASYDQIEYPHLAFLQRFTGSGGLYNSLPSLGDMVSMRAHASEDDPVDIEDVLQQTFARLEKSDSEISGLLSPQTNPYEYSSVLLLRGCGIALSEMYGSKRLAQEYPLAFIEVLFSGIENRMLFLDYRRWAQSHRQVFSGEVAELIDSKQEKDPECLHLPDGTQMVDTGIKQFIKTLPDAPTTIIRVGPKLGNDGHWEQAHHTNVQILHKLRDTYGISIPSFEQVKGQEHFYMITEFVDGMNLRDLAVKPNEVFQVASKVDELYPKIIAYLAGVAKDGGWMIGDLTAMGYGGRTGNEQFVYGKTKTDTENTIYLVDLGPALDRFETRAKNGNFVRDIKDMYFMIREMEQKLGVRLEKSWDAFDELLNELSASTHGFASEVKDFKEKMQNPTSAEFAALMGYLR